MKKIFAIALAVVMVLSIASVASAFEWGPGAATTNDNFGIQVSVEKYALNTGVYSWNYVEDPYITAANGADVYYVVKATYTKDISTADAVNLKVDFEGIQGKDFSRIVGGQKGETYYYNGNTGKWNLATANTKIDDIVIRARCFDTTSAAITVEATSSRDLTEVFSWGGYYVLKYDDGSKVLFFDVESDANHAYQYYFNPNDNTTKWVGNWVCFNLNGDGLVVSVDTKTDGQYVTKLYSDLGFTYADVDADKIYMNDDNLRSAFGFSYKVTDSVNWTATNHPIIVDTNVGIPKTGDNASVIGFAMIMVAVVAAAVAVRKVNA